MSENKQQTELFKAETTWFHIFKDMIDSGDMAKLDGSAVKVYLVVKSYTNFSTGRAFPEISTISEKAGLSESQVMRCLKALESMGYISKEKKGRRNVYTLREKVAITDETGRPTAVATWDYLPSTVSHAVADLKNVLVTGELAGARIVHIEKLQVQVINGEGNTGIQINEADLAKMAERDPEMFERLMSIRDRAREKKASQQG